jgi:type I restriction enzyme S subunit
LDAAFEKIDRAIELTEKNIIGLQVLYETYFANLLNNVSGSTCLLEEVCAINSKLIDPKVSKYQDLLHVGGANIEPLNGNLVRLKSAKQENIISGKFIFDENMILYSKIRPYLKKVARPAFSGLCSADIYPLVPLENIRKDYLYYLLLSEKFTSYAISGSGRAGMPKVNRPYLFAYKFTLPTLKIQDSIIGMLDEISMITSRLKTKYELKKATLMTLKQSMLHQAFSDDGV